MRLCPRPACAQFPIFSWVTAQLAQLFPVVRNVRHFCAEVLLFPADWVTPVPFGTLLTGRVSPASLSQGQPECGGAEAEVAPRGREQRTVCLWHTQRWPRSFLGCPQPRTLFPSGSALRGCAPSPRLPPPVPTASPHSSCHPPAFDDIGFVFFLFCFSSKNCSLLTTRVFTGLVLSCIPAPNIVGVPPKC